MSEGVFLAEAGGSKVIHARESSQPLLTPYRMGDFDLPNRVIMSPLTRMRADIHEAFLALGCVLICWRFLDEQETVERTFSSYCSFAYSALACLRMGMSESASFQSVRKSL